MREHAHPEMEARAQEAKQLVALIPEVVDQNGFNILAADPSLLELFPIFLLR